MVMKSLLEIEGVQFYTILWDEHYVYLKKDKDGDWLFLYKNDWYYPDQETYNRRFEKGLIKNIEDLKNG